VATADVPALAAEVASEDVPAPAAVVATFVTEDNTVVVLFSRSSINFLNLRIAIFPPPVPHDGG